MEKLIEKGYYRCGKIKPLEDFNKNKSKPKGTISDIARGIRKNFTSPFIWKFIDEKDLGEINANK